MSKRLPFAPLALGFLLLAAACSEERGGGDEDGDGGGGGAASGPVPSGAVAMEVYATMEQTCPPGNVHIDIGGVQTVPPELVADGQEGARVSCSVALAGGDELAASGSIERGGIAFSFGDLVTAGGSALGAVAFVDPASGARYASPESAPCVFQFAPGTEQGIAPGRIWVQFDCSSLVGDENPGVACSSRYGYLRFEQCEGSP